MAKKKKPIDWLWVERDYTKTKLPVRELARDHGCDEKAIRLRAKVGRWLRPGQENSAATPQAPQPLAAVIEPIVQGLRDLAPSEPTRASDIVEGVRRVCLRLVDELEAVTAHQDKMAEIIDEALQGKDAAKQRAVVKKALSLSERAVTAKNLALTVKTLAEANAPAGKKAAAAENARSAGAGSEWGDDLGTSAARPN